MIMRNDEIYCIRCLMKFDVMECDGRLKVSLYFDLGKNVRSGCGNCCSFVEINIYRF